MNKCKNCGQDSNNLSMLCPSIGGFHDLPEDKTYTESDVQVILELIIIDLKMLYSQCDDDEHVTKKDIIEIVKHQQDRLKC